MTPVTDTTSPPDAAGADAQRDARLGAARVLPTHGDAAGSGQGESREAATGKEAPGGERARRIRAMFSAIAHAYDFNNHLLSGGTDIAWRRRVVREALRGFEGAARVRVLDCCTGTGDLAIAFAKKLGARGEVTGGDFTEAMLDIARTKAAPRTVDHGNDSPATTDLPRVDFLQADSMALPFEDDAFDLATVAFGIRNVAEPAVGLREMARVVRPGGRVVVLEFTQPPNRLFRRVYYWYFFRLLPWLGGLFSGRRDAYGYLAQSVVEFDTVESLADKMRAAGLTDIRWHRLTFGIAAIHLGEKGARE
jgi:demethylmenaquinone methyltransferase/2-methoxy-6-polyprenyl-1,4-benzoquinol methylase